MAKSVPMVLAFEETSRSDIARVGGKNASLGEMIRTLGHEGIQVPRGFATTADAYWSFVKFNDLEPLISSSMSLLGAGSLTLAEAGAAIRNGFTAAAWPVEIADAIRDAYATLCGSEGISELDVAVRSSATAEDLPDASFAGQQESFLSIRGDAALLDACRRCYASLFTDRAISYRKAKGFDGARIALSVGVQRMVRSDIGSSGVMFSIDTETGFDKVVLINAAWGLGENVVQGVVDPDEYMVFKPLLDNPALVPIIEKKVGEKAQKMICDESTDTPTRNVATSAQERAQIVLGEDDILMLARWARVIEKHYRCPMDIEWAKDGITGEIFIVQARPETVQSRLGAGVIRNYRIGSKGPLLLSGLSIGEAIANGRVCLIESAADIEKFVDGSILVAQSTDPDWVPIMRRAAAIVTDHGGRTSHAAIVSRELGLPAVVGASHATRTLRTGQLVTVSCAEGDEGFVYDGIAEFTSSEVDFAHLPHTRTQIMLNLANPAAALRWWRMPADGVGLARMEFVISNHIKIHPMALVRYDALHDGPDKDRIAALTAGYSEKTEYFVDRLSRGLARIAAVAYPRPVIVRMSDFKTNEYAHLMGGAQFEPTEANPMIGFRGASRYYSPLYQEGFALECRALARLRGQLGFDNVIVMIPFCRSTREADRVLETMAQNGLERGSAGLQVYVMCEIPSNVILAKAFAERFDGFSIGSNDLTQLTLGVDRDSGQLSELFDEQDEAVKWMIRTVTEEAHRAGAKVGLCGQAPSDHPEFAEFLVSCGIDSISVTPDSFAAVKQHVAAAERELRGDGIKREDVSA